MILCVCESCGGPFRRKPNEVLKGHGRFCSQKCFGYYLSKKGDPKNYREIKVGGLRIMEHISVVESAIGRKLQYPPEEVHHIDGCPKNNKKENLCLCDTARAHRMLHAKPGLAGRATLINGIYKFSMKYLEPPHHRMCSECGLILWESYFYNRGNGGKVSICKHCKLAHSKADYRRRVKRVQSEG
jgi:hypothetical protein